MEFQRHKLLVWLIVLGVLPLFLATAFTSLDYFGVLAGGGGAPAGAEQGALAGQQDEHIAAALAEEADRRVASGLEATLRIAKNPKLVTLDPDDLEGILASQPRNNPGLLAVYAVKGPEGRTVFSTAEGGSTRDWKVDGAFTSPYTKGEAYISSPASEGGKLVFVIGAPISEQRLTQGPTGFVMKQIPVGSVVAVWDWSPVVEAASRIRIGRGGRAYLVDAQGLVLAGPEAGELLRQNLSEEKGLSAPLSRIAKRETGTDRVGFRGNDVLASAAACKQPGWGGIVLLPVSELADGAASKSPLPMAVSAALLLVALGLAFVLWRRISRPMEELATAMVNVTQGNLAVQLRQPQGEFASMLHGFNAVVGRIKALSENNQNLQQTREDMSRKVDQLSSQVQDLGRKLEDGVSVANRQLDEKVEELSAFRRLDAGISRAQTIRDALSAALAETAKLLSFDMSFALLVDDEKGLLSNPVIGGGVAESVVKALKIPLSPEGGVAAQVLRERSAYLASDDLDTRANRTLIAGIGSRNFAALPLVLADAPVAVLFFGNADGGRKMDDALFRRLQAAVRETEPGLEKTFRLGRMEAGLAVVNQMKNDSVHTISKELHAALGIIKNYVSSLLDSSKQRINEEEFLGMVMNRSVQLERLIDDLVNFSQLDAADARRMEKVSFGPMLKTMGTTYQVQAQVKGVTFDLTVPASLPDIRGDKARLNVALTSLISNAIKVSLRGGKVSVTARAAGGAVELTVADSGIGIAAEHLARIFTTFHGPDETENDLKGTGLKLPLARRIVESHGGRISIESEVGKGSRFIVQIPVAS